MPRVSGLLDLSLAEDFSEGLVASGAVEEAYC